MLNPETGVWRVYPYLEHNHTCDGQRFDSYITDSTIPDKDVRDTAINQMAAGGNPSLIREQSSRATGRTFTKAQYNNFRTYRLGGGLAAVNLEKLLEAYREHDGARCVTIHDQADVVVGVVFQTAMQRAMFQRYGDSLCLDWTHNTNNLGFYLGSLMVVSPSGMGVPVCEFLSLSQNMEMMQTVLEFFATGNPSASERVASFVIDKDYKEWTVLMRVFPRAEMVLCQFHVIKWFKKVVAKAKYKILSSHRKTAIKHLWFLVYAETRVDFDRVLKKLESLLPDHALFHAYMEARWLSCVDMWANHARGRVYTAGMTTTNYIESHWGHLKAGLGKRRRIDLCVEAILICGTAIIMRREHSELVRNRTSTNLHEREHRFIRPLLRKMSASRARFVIGEWTKYVGRMSPYTETSKPGSPLVSVKSSEFSDLSFSVDKVAWMCSCRFATRQRLPCRHQLFVAHSVVESKLATFPENGLRQRWDMTHAADLVPAFQKAIRCLEVLRLSEVVKSTPTSKLHECQEAIASQVPLAASVASRPAKPGAIKCIHVKRREVGDIVVLNSIEKRNMAKSQCSRVVRKLQELGAVRFWGACAKLEKLFDAFLDEISSPGVNGNDTQVQPGSSSTDRVSSSSAVGRVVSASSGRGTSHPTCSGRSSNEDGDVSSTEVGVAVDQVCGRENAARVNADAGNGGCGDAADFEGTGGDGGDGANDGGGGGGGGNTEDVDGDHDHEDSSDNEEDDALEEDYYNEDGVDKEDIFYGPDEEESDEYQVLLSAGGPDCSSFEGFDSQPLPFPGKSADLFGTLRESRSRFPSLNFDSRGHSIDELLRSDEHEGESRVNVASALSVAFATRPTGLPPAIGRNGEPLVLHVQLQVDELDREIAAENSRDVGELSVGPPHGTSVDAELALTESKASGGPSKPSHHSACGKRTAPCESDRAPQQQTEQKRQRRYEVRDATPEQMETVVANPSAVC